MTYLSLEEVVAIHYEVIRVFGGSQGIRDFGLLHSAIERPKASFSGEDLYTDVYLKAGALLHSLILNHAFVDGNKRTAYVSLARFLAVNGFVLMASKNSLIEFVLRIEKEKVLIKEIASWIRKNTSNK